jgi:hypothetical protein
MLYSINTSINTKIAPIVKWYNMSMVRINFKFDSWWGHQKLSHNQLIEQNKIFLFFVIISESNISKLSEANLNFSELRFIRTKKTCL